MLQNRVIPPPKVITQHEYVAQIKNRSKTVEGRIYQGLFRNLQPGHRIEFVSSDNPQNSIVCKIRYTKRYNNFREMLQGEGFRNCFPRASSLEQAVSICQGIPEYSRQVTIYGALAIAIDIIL